MDENKCCMKNDECKGVVLRYQVSIDWLDICVFHSRILIGELREMGF